MARYLRFIIIIRIYSAVYPNGFEAVRYHSLVAENFPECLIQTAKTSDGINMALQHKTYPLYGVQFHPEAILTQYGHKLLQNFISI